jgi:poly-gamma-glutamate synthesis protein (capsule biosynthesis protein)
MRTPATGGRALPASAVVLLATIALAAAMALPGLLPFGATSPAGSGPTSGGGSSASAGASSVPSPVGTQVASATASPPAPRLEPIVPATSFRAAWDSTDGIEVAAVLGGGSRRYHAIELPAADADAILAALGVSRPAGTGRLVIASDPGALRADLARHPDRLGFLRLGDVDPSVRALAWGGRSLFGVDRVASLGDWPLAIEAETGSGVPAPGRAAYDPGTAWSLVAAGDVMLDRRVAYAVKQEGRGVDFPFDGGSATITRRTCCNPVGEPMPVARRTGDRGAVRALLSGADLALANFENAAPDEFTYHATGYTFTADPALIEGLRNAGFDWVSVANNHIRNAGGSGLVETLANLDRWGIAHSGAGPDLDAARRPSFFEVGGIRVAILGYDTIRRDFSATATRPGTNEMTPTRVRRDVAAARAAGADLVIVFPHWGIEYTAQTTARQRKLAHAAIDAGADLVIGSHPHWAGGIEVYRGVPIFYCLGDFVFDIDLSEQTLEGIVPELTFIGTRLVQVRLHPYLILNVAQPNWLDPAGSGAVVMRQVFRASPWLPW